MEFFTELKFCKYCTEKLELCFDEGLECGGCKKNIHVRCLKRGSVPGGLNGDLFYSFICQECSPSDVETFTRNKISWLQVINLVLYHLQTRSPGLARKGFFHWRNHVATFIDKNWEILFPSDVKKRKKWTGTVAGTLSHFGSYLFMSGTSIFHEPAWWTLMYPKLSPIVVANLYSLLTIEKQKAKLKNEKKFCTESEMFQEVLRNCIQSEELLQTFDSNFIQNDSNEDTKSLERKKPAVKAKISSNKRKHILPTIESTSKKLLRLGNDSSSILPDDLTTNFTIMDLQKPKSSTNVKREVTRVKEQQKVKLLDPFCHYNTSLNHISQLKGEQMQVKLMGGVYKDLILSPYSAIYLKPYIRRDVKKFPTWLRLMAEIQLTANNLLNHKDYVLPARGSIDFTYVQPEHIPAINSICNQFFWPGIDLTDSLQYPDFSCVVMYKKLVVGFAFLVPNVKHTENYLSFMFVRPGWRNCGIATFMMYHLIQTSLGKDITLHVSINNPALFLYQKFGFKVEKLIQNFYDKYYRNDVKESKHAFFCRLER